LSEQIPETEEFLVYSYITEEFLVYSYITEEFLVYSYITEEFLVCSYITEEFLVYIYILVMWKQRPRNRAYNKAITEGNFTADEVCYWKLIPFILVILSNVPLRLISILLSGVP
jgi:hypothetical protein